MAIDTDPLRDVFVALSRFFIGDATIEDTLSHVARLAVAALPGADFAGITMLVDGVPQTAVYTDAASPELDQAQYDAGEGPCLDAYREGVVHRIERMNTEERWPRFTQACRERSIGSTLSLPLALEGQKPFAALNLYAGEPEAFPQDCEELASTFAAAGSVVLANAKAYQDAFSLHEGLRTAMRSRAAIEQAKGVIMAQSRVGPEEAFEVLRRASQRENVKVRDIARRIVDDVSTPGGA